MNELKLINVLILGSGGREHAIAWKLKQSKLLNKLYVAPGNSGTNTIAENLNVDINNYTEIKQVILKKDIGLLVIGPEDPLVNGLHDQLGNDSNIPELLIIGPKSNGAQLEGSKSFAKKFMSKYNIPTANFKSFDAKNCQDAIKHIKESEPPFVIKADGLAAGKGVFIVNTVEEGVTIIEDIMIRSKFGTAGDKIVIETFLEGVELSVFILTDGINYKLLPTAKDYKRVGENDTGLNTGGMGAVSPVPFVDAKLMGKIKSRIIEPTLHGLVQEGIEYTGFIFFGLINVNGDPFVIEYNVRLGDPETQVIMPKIESDLLNVFMDMKQKELFAKTNIRINNSVATTIILTSGGYPENYKKGYPVNGMNNVQESILFHAGLKFEENKYLTNGGRVLAITSLANNIKNARENSYKTVEKISFRDMYFRKDIGLDLIK